MNQVSSRTAVQHIIISAEQAGRRIDNYLTGYFRDIPKTRIYQMLRKGEVRVNRGRVKPEYRLQEQDTIRIPPVFHQDPGSASQTPTPRLLSLLDGQTLYEDDHILAINKPAGLAVHAGSGERFGVIEILRALRPELETLELVHRLDKPTSGCLLLAKEHRVLRQLHNLFRENQVKKQYLALLKGRLEQPARVDLPLRKNELQSGERMVQVHTGGKGAMTRFIPERKFSMATLVRAEISTGRTHQIRVHAASIGHPVARDEKYGDQNFNQLMKRTGLKRMFLHAENMRFTFPGSGARIDLHAPLSAELTEFLDKL